MIDKNTSRRTRRNNSKYMNEYKSVFKNRESRIPKKSPYKRVKSFNKTYQVVDEE